MPIRVARLVKFVASSALVIGLFTALFPRVASADGATDPGDGDSNNQGGTSNFTVDCATKMVIGVVNNCESGFVPTQQVGTAYTGTACDGITAGTVDVGTGCNSG